MNSDVVEVQVIYPTLAEQVPVLVHVPTGSTINEALKVANIADIYPELKARALVVGIYGEIIHDPARYQLSGGERIEIYRPLLIDPKEARRRRAH